MKRTTVEEFDADGKLTKRTTIEVCEDEVVKRVEFVPARPYEPVCPCVPKPYPPGPAWWPGMWQTWCGVTTGNSVEVLGL